jgi:hypothetical protein
MPNWQQQMESERRQWEELDWWRALDKDPIYLEWLAAESHRITAMANGQIELLPKTLTED